ncbi:DUF4102 domain-containing protein [Pseudomonas extremaustralis]|uniref:DUF4102 domain-containing protein n=1 Tax=Pseudomonas extremaustralis TaxID=359110 RepID=UPI001980D796|nr:DUF4102 domain-containing protein [Pseudomonas extremaustralis]
MSKLTAKQVENLTDPGTYEDGGGLRLVIKDSGRKFWVCASNSMASGAKWG